VQLLAGEELDHLAAGPLSLLDTLHNSKVVPRPGLAADEESVGLILLRNPLLGNCRSTGQHQGGQAIGLDRSHLASPCIENNSETDGQTFAELDHLLLSCRYFLLSIDIKKSPTHPYIFGDHLVSQHT